MHNFNFLTQQAVDLLEASLILLLLAESQKAKKWRQTERRHSPVPTKYTGRNTSNIFINYMHVCKTLHNTIKL